MKRGEKLKGSVFIVHWKSSETNKYAKNLKKEGWIVETESQCGMRAFERIKRDRPDAVVIYLNRLPKRGREIGFTLKKIKMTSNLPVVFVTSREKKMKKTFERLPDAIFSTPKELNKKLEKLSKEVS